MRTITTPSLLLACTLAACGGDVGPVDSGLPAEKSGKDLTEPERESFCDAAASNLQSRNTDAERKEFTCVFTGLTATAIIGGTAEDCEIIAEMCRDGEGEPSMGGEEPACSLAAALATCDAPVADIEACLTEQNEALADLISSASCADADKTPTEAKDGPACAKIMATCPSV